MADKLLSIVVRGNMQKWSFEFYGDLKYLPEWRADGLEIDEVCNTIPLWVVNLGLTNVWCFLQDIFNFKNPWSK